MIQLPKWVADFGIFLNRLYYQQLFEKKYFGAKLPPSWFDHRIDLYYQWPDNLFWLERGVLPRKYMSEGCSVLDLFCGDGFYSRYFYSTSANSIDAIDKDPSAIDHARKLHSHPKIQYAVLDSTTADFPRNRYDVIVWFEGIEHLSTEDYSKVIQRIKSVMGQSSILFGSTPIVMEENVGKSNWEHENEFTNTKDLESFLGKDFEQIQIDVTSYPENGGGQRRTAYFTARKPR